jgi:hypothetical protein
MEIMEILEKGSMVLGALLAILGGLKVLARLTKSEWDDKALDAVERILSPIAALFGRGKKDGE